MIMDDKHRALHEKRLQLLELEHSLNEMEQEAQERESMLMTLRDGIKACYLAMSRAENPPSTLACLTKEDKGVTFSGYMVSLLYELAMHGPSFEVLKDRWLDEDLEDDEFLGALCDVIADRKKDVLEAEGSKKALQRELAQLRLRVKRLHYDIKDMESRLAQQTATIEDYLSETEDMGVITGASDDGFESLTPSKRCKVCERCECVRD